ncbi:MAG: SRPBCC family protein [Acidimicrobiales bacterium]|nr:SRPBCC family protein [Acidimicrobiales bacterium]HRW37935.1 SRPBCC family protein [Aquihabitans sp.]
MDIEAELVAPCSTERLFSFVEDLSRYPAWNGLVTRATPEDDGSWAVDLRGKLGPLARTKRLRMVRAEHRPPELVRFERTELDGRDHSPWCLTAAVDPAPAEDGRPAARLRMTLQYGGGLFQPVVERLLRDEIDRSRERLLALVAEGRPRPRP